MPARLASPIAAVAVAAVLLGGCGGSGSSSSSGGTTGGTGATSSSTEGPPGASATLCAIDVGGFEGVRATGVSCGTAQRLAIAWRHSGACEPAAGASRSSCSVRSYRCLATSTARGYTVGCSRPGHSVAFIVRQH